MHVTVSCCEMVCIFDGILYIVPKPLACLLVCMCLCVRGQFFVHKYSIGCQYSVPFLLKRIRIDGLYGHGYTAGYKHAKYYKKKEIRRTNLLFSDQCAYQRKYKRKLKSQWPFMAAFSSISSVLHISCVCASFFFSLSHTHLFFCRLSIGGCCCGCMCNE